PANPPETRPAPMPMPRPMPRGGPGRYPPPPPEPPQPPAQPDGSPADRSSNGSVVIQVQPGGADIVVDGAHWPAPARPDERLVLQLSPGHHVIEVHKSGYRDLRTEVDVRPGEATPVNASLTPDR